MKKNNTCKLEELSLVQAAALRNLSDTYVNCFSFTIKNEMSPRMMSTNGAELLKNLNMFGISYKRFFSSVEKRIIREFPNVQDAHFDYDGFLSNGVYILNLTYKQQKNEARKGSEAEEPDKEQGVKITRNTCLALFREYEVGEKLKRNELTTMDILRAQFEETPNIAEAIENLSNSYCNSSGLTGLNEQERLEAFLAYQNKVFFKLYEPFNVDIVAPSFTKNMDSVEMPQINEGKNLYDLIGECSGILALPEGIMEYVITKEGDYMRFIYNNYQRGRIMYSFNNSIFNSLPDDEYRDFFINSLKVLIVKRFGKVETQIIEGKGQCKVGKSYVVNKAPFPVHRLDGSWLKTIIRLEGFGVKGHIRLQACGKGWKDHKLVFIKPYKKHGYVRTAPAVLARASA